MKPFIKFLLFFWTTASVSAQNELRLPGTILVGGTFAYTSASQKADNATANTNNTTANTYSYNPSVGYFIQPRLAVGIASNFFRLKETNSTGSSRERSINSWVVGPMMRNYYLISKHFGVLTESCLGFGSGKTASVASNTNFNSSTKSSLFAAGISPGAYVLLGNLSLDLRIGGWQYQRSKVKSVTGSSSTAVGVTSQYSSLLLSLQNIQVGATLFFGQKVSDK